MRRCLLAAIYALPYAAARLLHSLPEDPAAFPKYRVAFLNALPVLNQTAEKWLRDGLRGGELEFLDSQWSEGDVSETYTSPKEIGSGDTHEEFHTSRVRILFHGRFIALILESPVNSINLGTPLILLST